MKKGRYLGVFVLMMVVVAVSSANAATWATMDGRVLDRSSVPICAMVLANGQHMFSCGGTGNYNMRVPLDSKGLVTLQVFASGFAPYKQTLTAGQAIGYNVYMERDVSGRAFNITYNESPSSRPGWVLVSGNINHSGTPLCAMILINGQRMFSCNQDLGRFSLEVPLDNSGYVTVQAFAGGFMPYRAKFLSSYPDTSDTFSLAVFKSTTPGTVYSTQLTGSDSRGASLSGSLAMANRNKEMLNGVLVTPSEFILNLSGGGFFITVTSTGYRNANGDTVLVVVQTIGLVCTPVSPGNLPDTVKIGDFGITPSSTCNDGTTQANNWRTEDAGNGRINLITSSTVRDYFNDIVSVTDITWTLNSSGSIVGFKTVTTQVQDDYTQTYRSK